MPNFERGTFADQSELGGNAGERGLSLSQVKTSGVAGCLHGAPEAPAPDRLLRGRHHQQTALQQGALGVGWEKPQAPGRMADNHEKVLPVIPRDTPRRRQPEPSPAVHRGRMLAGVRSARRFDPSGCRWSVHPSGLVWDGRVHGRWFTAHCAILALQIADKDRLQSVGIVENRSVLLLGGKFGETGRSHRRGRGRTPGKISRNRPSRISPPPTGGSSARPGVSGAGRTALLWV